MNASMVKWLIMHSSDSWMKHFTLAKWYHQVLYMNVIEFTKWMIGFFARFEQKLGTGQGTP